MRATILIVALSVVILSAPILADVPGLINYQGTLTDDDGVALDTTVAMTFAIYTDSTGGGKVWFEIQPAVVVSQGLFNVMLGRISPIPDTVFDWLTCWLSVKVGVDPELQPRQRIASTGYSFRAAEADTADYARSSAAASDGDWTISGIDMHSAVSGNVGIGIALPERKLHIYNGSAGSVTASPYAEVVIEDDDHSMIHFLTPNVSTQGLYFGDSDLTTAGWLLYDHNQDEMRFATVGSMRMTIGSNGNVGIATSSPDYTLDVNGNAGFNDYIYHNQDGDTYLFLSTDQMDLYAGNVRMLTVDEDAEDAVVVNENSADVDFRVESDNETHALFVRGSDGNVGIGTTNPSYNLHVYDGSSGNFGYMASSSYGVYGKHAGSSDYGYLGGSGIGVLGSSNSGYGVYGSSGTYGVYGANSGSGNYGYLGTGSYGVYGSSSWGYGVYGYSTNNYGVYGSHSSGNYGIVGSSDYGVHGHTTSDYGVHGWSTSTGTGVYGYSLHGYALHGYGGNSHGVHGYSGYGLGVYGEHSGGNFGYIGSINYGVFGADTTSGNYGYIGGSDFGMFANLGAADVGNYAIYGDGVDAPGEDGSGYSVSFSLGGVEGFNFWGNPYTFGVAGYSYLDYDRSGACFGGRNNAGVWGCFGYQASGGLEYGGYCTNWASAPKDQLSTGIGLGSWGDLFGADIHGKIYGTYTEGGSYALYSNGDVFTNGMDVHLQDTETPSMAVLYTNVSTDVTVQTSGYGTLSKGTCHIEFDDDFKKVVSADIPVVVTVTPTGNCNGVYVSAVTKEGFTVVENNGGKSSVIVSFIAIGRRAGYEDPKLPPEVISSDYVDKLSRGLHNDADTDRDGEGLYFEDGQLYVGVHSSTLPDPNRRRQEPKEIVESTRELSDVQERERLERRLREERARHLAQEARRIEEERRTRLEVEEKRSR